LVSLLVGLVFRTGAHPAGELCFGGGSNGRSGLGITVMWDWKKKLGGARAPQGISQLGGQDTSVMPIGVQRKNPPGCRTGGSWRRNKLGPHATAIRKARCRACGGAPNFWKPRGALDVCRKTLSKVHYQDPTDGLHASHRITAIQSFFRSPPKRFSWGIRSPAASKKSGLFRPARHALL